MVDRRFMLGRFARAIARTAATEPLTWRLCEASRSVVGADGASITVDNDTPNRVTLCATDRTSAQLENLQDVLGEGPCIDAFRTGLPVSSRLSRETVRWPMFIEGLCG